MGVHGLWQLLQPTGRPVNLETLEGKILAVDISIWLNQLVKGMRDRQGNAIPNAHLIGLFKRICKLLFYRIKPVFVFDGGVPALKKHTLAQRRQLKEEAKIASRKTTKNLLKTVLKHHAVREVLNSRDGKKPAEIPTCTSATGTQGTGDTSDIFQLPPLPDAEAIVIEDEETGSDSVETDMSQRTDVEDLYETFEDPCDIDVTSEDFKALPAEIQHELLTEIKESKKRNAWKHVEHLPEDSDDFSKYQLAKLMKQNKLSMQINQVRQQLTAESVGNLAANFTHLQQKDATIQSQRVVSADSSHYILIKGLKNIKEHEINEHKPESSAKSALDALENGTQLKKSEVQAAKTSSSIGRFGESARNQAVLRVSSGKVVEVCLSSDEEDPGGTSLICGDVEKSTGASKSADMLGAGGFIIEEEMDDNDKGDLVSQAEQRNVTVLEKLKPTGFSESRVSITRTDNANDKNHTESLAANEQRVLSKKDFETKNDNKIANIPSIDECSGANNPRVDLVDDKPRISPIPRQHIDRETGEVSEENTDEEDFIEITIDPKNMKPDDDLFPASIFATGLQHSRENSASPIPELTTASSYFQQEVTDRPIVIDDEQSNIPDLPENDVTTVENEFQGITQSELVDMEQELEVEARDLQSQRGQQERVGASITDQMYIEAQDLLKLFGLPYVVSPTEAEAQCAFLDLTEQTNGSITDDSDVWLFGGRCVYKNFFNQNKHVEMYRFEDIQSQLMLDRERMILLALLCGSDYTDGIDGVGPVTAMEIIGEFKGAGISGLTKLKDWWEEAQQQHMPPAESKLRNKLRKLEIRKGFPNPAVTQAYLEPAVDESTDTFSWGKPDLDLLREYATVKLGWTQAKTDELVLPVMKQLNEKQTQLRITSFVVHEPEHELKSKRIKNTIARLKNGPGSRTTKGKITRGAKAKNLSRAENSNLAAGGFVASSLPRKVQEVGLSESSSESENGFEAGFASDSSGDDLLGALDLEQLESKSMSVSTNEKPDQSRSQRGCGAKKGRGRASSVQKSSQVIEARGASGKAKRSSNARGAGGKRTRKI